jgi:small redox-active disulfide protein 2
MLTIKILGTGCANCKRLEGTTRDVVETMDLEVEIVKVTSYPEIMSYGVLSTPGLVINEELVSQGRIPTQAEITTWLVDAMQTA